MQPNPRLSDRFFLLATGLISLFAYTVLFSAISFIRGYPISPWQFPVALVMMLITQYFATKELFETVTRRIFFQQAALLLGIIALCIVFAGAIYDISTDGQWYHQETVYQIKTGWNPYVHALPVPKIPGVPDMQHIWCSGPHVDPVQNPLGDQPVRYLKYISINHFPKAVEMTEAAIYTVTGRIETGKALNEIMLLASVFLCLSVLYKLNRFRASTIWMITALITLNPVVIAQLTSYCLDGVMYSTLVCLIAVFIGIIRDKNKYNLFLCGLLILVAVNIKFTTLVYAAVFCLAMISYLVWKKKRDLVKQFFITGTISFLVGFFFVGFHPYMTNLIGDNNIFAGLKETREENMDISPTYLKDKNRFQKFFASYGAHSYFQADNGNSLKDILKIPLTVNKQELLNANNPQLEVAGFGPFFSGALLAALIAGIILAFRYDKKPEMKTAFFIMSFLLFSIFVVPDPWWARFAPQIWLIPCFVLVLMEWLPARMRLFKLLLCLTIGLNIVWSLSGVFFNIIVTAHINYQIAQLQTLHEPIRVEYCGYLDLRANRVRFDEHHIPYIEKYVTGQHIYNVIHSTTRFETSKELPLLPEPLLMKIGKIY